MAQGCGSTFDIFHTATSLSAAATQCEAKQAQVMMRDGLLENLCGCTEVAGTTVSSSDSPLTSLTCTVAAGTTVFFHFARNRFRHQIVSTGTPRFLSSTVYDPIKLKMPYVHVFQFSDTGTFEFQDSFDGALTGRIVVQ